MRAKFFLIITFFWACVSCGVLTNTSNTGKIDYEFIGNNVVTMCPVISQIDTVENRGALRISLETGVFFYDHIGSVHNIGDTVCYDLEVTIINRTKSVIGKEQ